jgi:beta-lactamase class A
MRLVTISPRPGLGLEARLARVERCFSGRLGYSARHAESGAQLEHRADESFPTASVIKVFLVAALLDQVGRGRASLDEQVALPPRAGRVAGGGILKQLDADRFSLRDLVELAITVSDNAATNAVYERVGGAEAVAAFTGGIGLDETVMPGPVDFRRITNDLAGGIGVSTPRQTQAFLSMLVAEQILTPPLCRYLLDVLGRQHYQEQVPRWLGYDPYAQYHGRDQVLRVANKTGELDGIRADAAVIRHAQRGTLIVAIFTDQGADQRESVDVEGALCVAECAAAMAAHFLGLAC